MSVIIVSACAKDETGDMTGPQLVVPEESPPAAAPVWYPTPKKLLVAPGAGIPAPAASGSQPSPVAPTGQQPVISPQYRWPSDEAPAEEYSPWQMDQSTAQSAAGASQPGARRPWGAVEEVRRPAAPQTSGQVWQFPSGQPAWEPGYPPQQAQPGYPDGTVVPVPPGYPVYVW